MEALSAYSLPPGFGFHPTDAELVSHYLKRKILGLKIDDEIISEIDIYKHEPWDLPARCRVPISDSKWHFFTSCDKKYPNGSRLNRATEAGYWKSTGPDRNIKYQNRVIGTKKTLVFHEGRPPRGKRTEWIMHEYYVNQNEFKGTTDMKEGHGSVAVNHEPIGSHFHHDALEDSHLLFQVDEFPNPELPRFDFAAHFHHDVFEDSHLLFQVDEFLSPEPPSFDFCRELDIQNFNSFCDDPQEDVDVSAYLNSDIDELTTTNNDSATWTGIQIRERETKPSSTTTLSSRIKFQVSKMESRNCETLCQISEVSGGVHLGRINSWRSDNKIVSTKALKARKGSSFGPLAYYMSCFFCMMGIVAFICYFSRYAQSSKSLEL